MASQTVPAGWELICRRRLEGLQAPTQAFGMDGWMADSPARILHLFSSLRPTIVKMKN